MAAANEALASGTFRPVVGRSVVTTIEPACDYYLAEVRCRVGGAVGAVGATSGKLLLCLTRCRPRIALLSDPLLRPRTLPCLSPPTCREEQDYHQQYLSNGGRFKSPQSAEKGCKDKIRCYG